MERVGGRELGLGKKDARCHQDVFRLTDLRSYGHTDLTLPHPTPFEIQNPEGFGIMHCRS